MPATSKSRSRPPAATDLFDGPPVDRARLSEEVLDRLETLVISGKLRPGDKLPSERELMDRFGVGRPSIREALFALKQRGMIAASAGARPVVIEPRSDVLVAELSGAVRFYLSTAAGTREFQKGRRLLEPALARAAARAGDPEGLVRLKRALDDNRAALDEGSDRFIDTDVAFHFEIVRMSHAELLTALHRLIFEWLRLQRQQSIANPLSAQRAYRAHARIYKAIAAGDPDLAEAEMLKHLDQVESYYWDAAKAGNGEKS